MIQLELEFLSPAERRRKRLQERIYRNIEVDPATGCWRWTGKKTSARGGAAYPRITMRVPGYKTPRNLLATRVSLEVFVESPPAGAEAAHDPELCPYTDCVNPGHLRWASREENEADKRHPRRLRLREVHPPLHQLFYGDELVPF